MVSPVFRTILETSSEISAEDEEHHSTSKTLPIVGIFVIFFLGLSGSLIPPLIGSYFPKFDLNRNVLFRFFNGLAAGLVLAVGFVHSIPDSFESFGTALTGDTPTDTYAWPGFIAMMGALLTFAGEEFVHRFIGQFGTLHAGHGDSGHQGHSHSHGLPNGHTHGHGHGHGHGHSHSHSKPEAENTESHNSEENGTELTTQESPESLVVVSPTGKADLKPSSSEATLMDLRALEEARKERIGYYSELYVLLFGLSFHSVFVGLALGVVSDDWALFTAIVFHQFFEGLALGARVARAQFRSRIHIWMLDLVFGLAAPIGIAIGMGIQEVILGDDYRFLLTSGTFQALSGGILIYVSLVHMMKEEMERDEFTHGGPLAWAMYFGFAIGAGLMSIIGIWA